MHDFETFWAIYPRKQAKGDARKAWGQTMHIRPHIDEVVNAIRAQSKTENWQDNGGKFIPLPASWLRAERWSDILVIELPKPERKPDRYELANMEMARKEAEWKARQALAKAAA